MTSAGSSIIGWGRWAAGARLVARVAPIDVTIHPVPAFDDRFEVGMLWRERSHRDPASAWLRDQFRTAAAALDAPAARSDSP
ncbi:hypothetical protein [Sphingomonas sp.]|uniref:hypothetical protein n=1 Tax=Sphingomonas sp. TaxID=28214 RepID=UPI003CC5A169